MDVLDRATQAVLGTQDKQLNKTLKASNGLFSDILKQLNYISASEDNYHLSSKLNQISIQQELVTLNGHMANLPAVITSSVDKMLVPTTKIQSDVAVISAAIPQVTSALDAVKTSMSQLVTIARANTNILNNLSNLGASGGSDNGPAIGDRTTPLGPPPQNDYSNVFNDIEGMISNFKNSIGGAAGAVDPRDFLYDGFDNDVSAALHELVDAYTDNEGLDVNGLVSGITGEFRDFAESVATGSAEQIAGEMGEFVSGFTSNFISAMQEAVADVRTDLKDIDQSLVQVEPVVNSAYYDQLDDLISQFHNDNKELLMNIDQSLVGGFATVDSSVRRSGKSSISAFEKSGSSGGKGGSLGDLINAFDDTGDEVGSAVSTGSGVLGSLLDGIGKNVVGIFSGIISGQALSDKLNTLHTDSTNIIKATGQNRKEALATRRAMVQNIYATYKTGTWLKEDVEEALGQAVRSGAVTQEHLQEASEAILTYNSLLPDVTLDLSQGWAKSLMVTKKDGAAYLENIALSLDTFSNNFYVSAGKLEKAVEMYTYSAQIFTNDFKGYSKAMNKMVGIMAAQEDANIQSMDYTEFFNRIAWTSLDQLGDADYARLANEFGISGKELLQFREAMRKGPESEDYQKWFTKVFDYQSGVLEKQTEIMQHGSATQQEGQLVINQSVLNKSYEEMQKAMAETVPNEEGESQRDIMRKNLDKVFNGDYSSPDTAEGTKAEAADRAYQNQNLTWEDKLSSIATKLSESGLLGKIFDTLSGMGFGGSFLGSIFGSIAGSAVQSAGKAIASKLLGGGSLKGAFTGLFSKGGLKAAGSKLAGGIKGLPAAFGKLGTKIKGLPEAFGKLGTKLKGAPGFFGKLGTKLKGLPELFGKFGTKIKGLGGPLTKAGTALKSGISKLPGMFSKAGSAMSKAGSKVMSKLVPALSKGAEAGKGLLGKAGSAFGKAAEASKGGLSKAGSALGKAAPKLGKLAGKAASVLAVAEGVWDVGAGANKSEEWLGGNDSSSKIAAGVGGFLGGSSGEGGLKSAASGALKGAGIGAAIGSVIPVVGTAVGGAVGAAIGGIGGAIGGEKIARFVKDTSDWLSEKSDNVDLWLEEHMGGFGKTISSLKNTAIDYTKDTLGGLFSGIGSLVKGLGGGIKKIFHGEFKEGFKEMGSGLWTGVKDVFGGFKKAGEDIYDDWTMDAKDRIAKRKAETEALNGQVKNAEKNVDNAQKKLNQKQDDLSKSVTDANKKAAASTAKAGFSVQAKRSGGVADASGLNPYSYADYEAKAIAENNRPRDLSQIAGQNKSYSMMHEAGFATAQNVPGVRESLTPEMQPEVSNAEIHTMRDSVQNNPEAVVQRQRMRDAMADPNSSAAIATPIVSALNNNNSSVVGLLDRIAKAVENGGVGSQSSLQQQKAAAVANQPGQYLQGRVPNGFGNKDDMANNQVLNYQGVS